MKIAFFSDTFLPEITGISTCIANVSQELGRRGHEVKIFTYDWPSLPPVSWAPPNVEVVRWPSICLIPNTFFRMSWRFGKLWRRVKEFHPDVIHFHTPSTLGIFSIFYAKKTHTPLVGTIHTYLSKQNADVLKIATRNKYLLPIIRTISLTCNRWVFDRCDMRLAPSRLLIEELVSGGLSKEISFLPNPAPQSAQTAPGASVEEVKERYGLRHRVIIHVGRISPEKKVDLLIRAFKKLSESREDVSLLILGDGSARESLERLVAEEHLEGRVVFTGFIKPDVLMQSGLFAASDFFATMSTMENQPMVVLEAMIAGLPIAGVRAGGLTELITDNGIIVPPDDIVAMAAAFSQMLSDDEGRKRMAQCSKENARFYSAANISDKLIGYYEGLMERRGKK